jgi:hypothetical protein
LDVYVVLSKVSETNHVPYIVVVVKNEEQATKIVNKRKQDFPTYYCWYEHHKLF